MLLSSRLTQSTSWHLGTKLGHSSDTSTPHCMSRLFSREKAGLRTGCGVRSQVIDVLKAQIKRRPAMKKVSTVAAKPSRKISQQQLTIGPDLGDRNSWYCVLDEAGRIQLGGCEPFGRGGMCRCWRPECFLASFHAEKSSTEGPDGSSLADVERSRKPSRRETGGTCCSFIRSPRSSRFLRRQTELDHSSPLLLREPHTLREIRWNVKLNHFCHSPVLQMAFLRDLTR